ncbi:hypothetical protein [Pedobacter africanus]|uniref:Uncharacterized protein n=1 Tax=Pedobacter africanus TaxID=151894 RepID=A0A1W1Z9J5_9SPHI|nr:hypothetical protein [Pedobacter africanus]SMC45065.1 hypothetical protein SAMN04488524_0508 [Pedobacter africanus]
MSKQEEQLNALNDIKKLMDRSSRFISLSGLSGVFAGVTALLGAYLAHVEINNYMTTSGQYSAYPVGSSLLDLEFNLLKIGLGVLVVALAGGLLFTLRQSKKRNLPFWDRTTKNLLINLAIPLFSGGLFIIALLLVHPNTYGLIAPSCLVFYGLALINASKYTYSDIRYLGLCEIILGLIAMFYIGYGLYFWAIGFGILHIFYGMLMYFKYERAR